MDKSSGEVLEDLRTLATPLNAVMHGDVVAAAQLGGGNVIDARTGDVLVGGLAYPLGLASDGSTLYVGDWASGVVWAKPPGGSAVQLADGLLSPEGLALDGDRLLVVEEALDRVVAIDLATGDRSVVVQGLGLGERVLPAALPHGSFNGIAVDDHAIFVSSDVDNAVYEFKR